MTARSFKVVRTDRELECPELDAALGAMGGELVLLPDGVGEGALCAAVADADLLLMCYTPVTAAVIGAARRLKGIVKYGVGIDAIDIEAARARRIPVVNVPEYGEQTVAEGAFALLIALARKLVPLDRAMHRHGWVWPTGAWRGTDIAGSTLGLVGAGRIGRALARMAGAGFGARVLGYDPHLGEAALRAAGIEPCADLRAMLSVCDFVSVHCVLNAETHHLIGADELACMGPRTVFVNVSRGAIVDEQALVEALVAGRIGAAGLDVFSREPLTVTGHPLSPLFAMDNVILTPHLAFYTDQAMARLQDETLERCREMLEGRPVVVKSADPRLRAQRHGVIFVDGPGTNAPSPARP